MFKKLPEEMSALQIDAYHYDAQDAICGLQVVKKPIPVPGYGQVLVKIQAAPCNPSDLLFLQGHYGIKKPLPAVPGWEGAGTVVATGGGLKARWLKGKRVACGGQGEGDGTWAEYYVADANACIPLKDNVDFDQGATLIINPLTAVGMVEKAKMGGHRAIIQTAAASQLGRMVLRLTLDANIPTIHIVRRQRQMDLLLELGATHVLNSQDPDFRKNLRELSERLNATIAFDAVAGPLTGELLSAMPQNSKVLVYGGLSGEACCGISPLDLIFNSKQVSGFWLSKWIAESGFWGLYQATNHVQRLMETGSFKTTIRKRVGLSGAVAALLDYERVMTTGKVIIDPTL